MENRLLLAFVLSIGVFIGWGYVMSVIEGPPPAQIQSEKEVAEIPPATLPSTALQPQPSANPETPSEQTAPNIPAPAVSQAEFPGEETTVQISVGKVTYVITNKGAITIGKSTTRKTDR